MARAGFAVVGVAVLLAVPGCGGGGSSSAEGQAGVQKVPVAFARGLSKKLEQQMRAKLHDQHFRVHKIECEGISVGITHCKIESVDGHGRRGAIQVGVTVAGGATQVQVTNVTNRDWARALSRTS